MYATPYRQPRKLSTPLAPIKNGKCRRSEPINIPGVEIQMDAFVGSLIRYTCRSERNDQQPRVIEGRIVHAFKNTCTIVCCEDGAIDLQYMSPKDLNRTWSLIDSE
jgi:hypothetical protein